MPSSITSLPTHVAGVMAFATPAIADERGYFKEAYVKDKYAALGVTDTFVQDSISYSRKDTLRGLHTDPRMSKLVHVIRGEVFDVIVDARRNSVTFGQTETRVLSEENSLQLYIPPGCLHGFLAVSNDVIFSYKQSAQYDPSREYGVLWNDAELGIPWPVCGEPVVSPKDRKNRRFVEVVETLSSSTHFDC